MAELDRQQRAKKQREERERARQKKLQQQRIRDEKSDAYLKKIDKSKTFTYWHVYALIAFNKVDFDQSAKEIREERA
jgi:hypothetical protein